MEQLEKLMSQMFDEIDSANEYYLNAMASRQDQRIADAYLDVASSKLSNAETLRDAARDHVSQVPDEDRMMQRVWDILAKVVTKRIEYAKGMIDSFRR